MGHQDDSSRENGLTLSYTTAHSGLAMLIPELASKLDHALLKPTLTLDELTLGCREAVTLGVASVCALPFVLPDLLPLVQGSSTRLSTTVGFPHGGHCVDVKRAEILQAAEHGAHEVDAVVNLSLVMSRKWDSVDEEVRRLVETAHEAHMRIKIIFENAYLDDAQKKMLCRICTGARADFVKTSTGFAPSGATLDDVRLMRAHVPPEIGVKASGGITTREMAVAFVEAGASRIGTSNSAALLAAS
jgi:deoxyribose-phosphate aldolase